MHPSLIFTIKIGIGTYFVYYKYMNPNKKQLLKKDSIFQATITKYNSTECNSVELINEASQTNTH